MEAKDIADLIGSPSKSGRGGARPGSGRKKKVNQDDHYTRLAKAKADHEGEKAKLAEMERREREGELITATEVEKRFVNMAAMVKAKLLAVPGKIAPHLVAITDLGEADAIIKAAIHDALKDLKQ